MTWVPIRRRLFQSNGDCTFVAAGARMYDAMFASVQIVNHPEQPVEWPVVADPSR